jgi:hypothetical protein
MSIDHLKKQAKNLKAALPAFLEQHPSGAAPLAAFQELVARASGYPNWHVAVQAKSNPPAAKAAVATRLAISVEIERMRLTEYTPAGEAKRPREMSCAVFCPMDRAMLESSLEQLDKFYAQHGMPDDFAGDRPPATYSRKFVRVGRDLTAANPSFVDGYSVICQGLCWLDDFAGAIEVGQPVFDQLCGLLPADFRGRIPYYHVENRPFHRLAYWLVLAHFNLQTARGSENASRLAKRMLKWWPNDNIGFRLLLDPTVVD